jgi:hypothetical protein
MKINRNWAIASAWWGCFILGLILYAYAKTQVATLLAWGFLLCLYLIGIVPLVTRRLRHARGLPYKPSWWWRFVLDSDYRDSQRDEGHSQGHS